jgi:hypothetical protein
VCDCDGMCGYERESFCVVRGHQSQNIRMIRSYEYGEAPTLTSATARKDTRLVGRRGSYAAEHDYQGSQSIVRAERANEAISETDFRIGHVFFCLKMTMMHDQ